MPDLLSSTQVARLLNTNEQTARDAMDALGDKCQRIGRYRVVPRSALPELQERLTVRRMSTGAKS